MIAKTALDRVLFLISWWLAAIKFNNAIGFFDINKVAEGVALKILNEIYDYRLENLNYEKNNYLGIDLGDKTNKIGFQITSRKDARKIQESLGKFVKEPIEIYSNGIRFLILSQERKPQLVREKYQKICPGFDPERHILNADDLIEEISRIYESDRDKFYRIKTLLEVEIAGKVMRKENLKLLRFSLLEGSKKYYEALTGSGGRFRHINISDTILSRPRNEWINQQVSSEGEKGSPDNVLEALPIFWEKDCKHSVILGEGGMGKTVSIVRLWEDYLKNRDENSPIPIFIALNEYNQISGASDREDFILATIKRNYFNGTVSDEEIWDITKTPLQKEGGFLPSMILLLDGFNEITIDRRELLIEIRRLIELAQGSQIVITTRYDMRGNFNWTEFNLLNLLELEDVKVDSYIQEEDAPLPTSDSEEGGIRLRQLIRNPMMLTLYTSTSEFHKEHRVDENCNFKERVESPGELLWNYLEAQVVRLPKRMTGDLNKQWFYKFLVKFLLPAIGYEMEKAERFEFSRDSLLYFIDYYCIRFCNEDFFNAFPEYERYEDDLMVGKCDSDKERRRRRSIILEIFTEKLFVLVEEGRAYRFLHQNFRDFFAAIHILNEMCIGLRKSEVAEVLKERIISLYVLRYIGEIEGEHYLIPYWVDEEGWKIKKNKNSILERSLDLCRGVFDNSIGLAVLNIVEIWKEARGELSGTDLSNLNLTNVIFNGVKLSRFYKGNYLYTNFESSLIHEKNLLYQAHTAEIKSLEISQDGKRFLTASDDSTIKEWDIETSVCIRTYIGHSKSVNNAIYSSDGKKVLSVSYDKTIKEWDVETGECINTYKVDHRKTTSIVYNPNNQKILTGATRLWLDEFDREQGGVVHNVYECDFEMDGNALIYSPDGKRILATSDDKKGIFKEWDITNIKEKVSYEKENIIEIECSKIFHAHSSYVNSLTYSPDSKKILSASSDKTIKEWDVKTGKCLHTYQGHSAPVTSAFYDPDGKKIISSSCDKTIRQWDVESKACLNIYRGHSREVKRAVYSPDGKKIVSVSYDRTVRQWDANTVESLKILSMHSARIKHGTLRSDGEKIVVACRDNTIKEWDIKTGKCATILQGHEDEVNIAIYSEKVKKVLSASADGTIKEWDIYSGKCLATYKGHDAPVIHIAYSKDEKKILSISSDGSIKEWDIFTGKCVNTLKYRDSSMGTDLHAMYSTDGEKIISTSGDSIKEWDINTGRCVKAYENYVKILATETVSGVNYSELAPRELRFTKRYKETGRVESRVCTSNNKKVLLASSDGLITEWDVKTKTCLKTYKGHGEPVNMAVYNKNEQKILSVSNHYIKQWDVATGKCEKTFEKSGLYNLSYAMYSADENKIFSTNGCGDRLTEWDIITEQCLKIEWRTRSIDGISINDDTEFFDLRDGRFGISRKVRTGNEIKNKVIKLFTNIPGLVVQGCTFRNLHPDSDLSDENKKLMKQYGAIFE
jgi:WD40 repeat protein